MGAEVELSPEFLAPARRHLAFLYGADAADALLEPLVAQLIAFRREGLRLEPPPVGSVSEREVVLIAYGDT